MMVNAERYANWKAPSQDGDLLIWPQPAELLRQTEDNARFLESLDSVQVGGVAVAELRRSIRSWLGHTDNRPLIATGHQTELYHPGVWVKGAVINSVADRAGGSAYHFAVDTDHPKHLNVRWPGTTLPITDDPALSTSAWSGLLASPTPAHLRSIEQALAEASARWDFQPMLPEVLASLRRSAMDGTSLSAAITNAEHLLDWQLGLRHHAMLVSPMLLSQTYLVFVRHILSHAAEFAADYNSALADYRLEAGIRSQTRPMPDLRTTSDAIEVPFWLDNLVNGTRQRAEVRRASAASSGDWCLATDGSEFILRADTAGETAAAELARWLGEHHLRLSPRALTLTTFLRLLVVDQFVHGIGGGRYDQVTDRLLQRHFKMDPPRFAVATGTLFFPGAAGRTRVCMPCVLQEGHRLKHNLLGDAKREILDRINSLPRRSVGRSLAFHNMHGALSAAAIGHPALMEWSAKYEASVLRDREENVLFDRELFYAMQSRQRLAGMIEAVNDRFAAM